MEKLLVCEFSGVLMPIRLAEPIFFVGVMTFEIGKRGNRVKQFFKKLLGYLKDLAAPFNALEERNNPLQPQF